MTSSRSAVRPGAGHVLRRVRGWTGKGLWAVLDQALFALTNFGVSVLLARWLSAPDFGQFAVASSLLLLMGTVQSAMITEPMLVFGPSRYIGRRGAYLRQLTKLHVALTVGMGALLLLGILVLEVVRSTWDGRATLLALAVASPGILYLWLARRAAYIDAQPRLAATGGLAYAFLVLAGMLAVAWLEVLAASTALLVLGGASVVVGAWLVRALCRTTEEPATSVQRSDVLSAHLGYGRWAFGSALLSWVPSNVVVLALPLWHSLEDAATLRVAMTLILPVLNVQTALAMLLMPTLVRARTTGRLRADAAAMTAALVAMGVLYAPVVVGLGPQLVSVLFGPQYAFGRGQLLALAAIGIIAAWSVSSGSLLRALERPDLVLAAYLAAAIVSCTIGLAMVASWGFSGALGSVIASNLTSALLATLAGWHLIAARSKNRSRGRYGAAPRRTASRHAGAPGVGTKRSSTSRWEAPSEDRVRRAPGGRHRRTGNTRGAASAEPLSSLNRSADR